MKLADWCLLSNVYKIKYLDSEYKALGCKLLVQTLLSCLYNNKIEVAGTRNVAQSGRAPPQSGGEMRVRAPSFKSVLKLQTRKSNVTKLVLSRV